MDKKESTRRLLSLYAQIWLYQLIGLIIFSVARLTLLSLSTSADTISAHSDSLPMFLWNAWRFDIQAITYISLPAIIGALAMPYFAQSAINHFKQTIRWYYAIIYTILTTLVTAEFFFMDNFQSRYNIVFFDFFDEGPWGLLQTMWQDYPFMKILVFVLLTGCVISFIGRFIARTEIRPRNIGGLPATIALTLMIAGITFVFMRGSVTRYTLQVEAFMVSTDEKINNAVPNAIYLLKKAYKERSNSFKLYSEEALLKKHGYKNIDEAIAAAGMEHKTGEGMDDKLAAALFSTIPIADTDSNHTSPNVLLILNESWSRFLLEMDDADSLDLLCSLRRHLEEDLLFGNIQSVRNGTIYSLETVTMAMPYARFFNSRYRYQSYPTSIAHPFKQNNYKTTFITGMDPTWENVNEGLTYQNFDTIIGRQDILHSIPQSTTSEIGVYDEFLMQYVEEYMHNNSDTPQFIMTLTTTNHPPFTYPSNMQLPPLTDKWYNSQYLTGEKSVLKKYGLGAQYANKVIGDFLTRFKCSEAARNTIIVIAGDHNVRSILDYEQVPRKFMYAVPLYIYIPKEIAEINTGLKDEIVNRYGSHLDILPTLAPLCFGGNTTYLNIGQNLLDTTKSSESYYSYNEKQLLSPIESQCDSLMKMMKARELLMELFYQQHFRKTTTEQ